MTFSITGAEDDISDVNIRSSESQYRITQTRNILLNPAKGQWVFWETDVQVGKVLAESRLIFRTIGKL